VEVFAQNFLRLLLYALIALIFARVIVSWVDPLRRNSASQWITQASEPIIGPVRRMLPQTGMADFSPMIVLIVLFTILRVVT
jgi:YggT family protein